MEVDDIQAQGCKFPRIGNGSRSNFNKIGNSKGGGGVYPDEEEDGEVKRGLTGGSLVAGGGVDRLCGWPSSRIVRVSRASGGKDRHSKVLTSKGLRDRRVRLSVGTAIQFYDLQDRLGYDQPSKAVEWLLKAAAKSIDELPAISSPFPETPNQLSNQLSDDKRSSPGTEQRFDSAELELDGDLNYQQQHHHVSLSKSACSSTSETSKGSGLSLSRSESRIKARERAKERMAEKEKDKDGESRSMNPISQSSFTELLTGGINNVSRETSAQNGSAQRNGGGVGEANLFSKPRWSSAAMDYFSSGLLAPSPSRNHNSSGFSGHHSLGNSPMNHSPFNPAGDPHQELQFSFAQDHLMPVASAASNDYNLNFTISSGLAGMNRGTLQSNSPSLMPPHVQRLSSIDGSNVPFFIGTAAPPNAAPVQNHHHQFPAGLDGRLQLYYGGNDGGRHTDQKGKGKN